MSEKQWHQQPFLDDGIPSGRGSNADRGSALGQIEMRFSPSRDEGHEDDVRSLGGLEKGMAPSSSRGCGKLSGKGATKSKI